MVEAKTQKGKRGQVRNEKRKKPELPSLQQRILLRHCSSSAAAPSVQKRLGLSLRQVLSAAQPGKTPRA